MFLEFYLFIDKLNEKLQMNLIVLNIMYNKSNIQRNFVNNLVCRIRHFFISKFYNVGDKSRLRIIAEFPESKISNVFHNNNADKSDRNIKVRQGNP